MASSAPVWWQVSVTCGTFPSTPVFALLSGLRGHPSVCRSIDVVFPKGRLSRTSESTPSPIWNAIKTTAGTVGWCLDEGAAS